MALRGTYRRMMKFDGAQALEDQMAAFATQWVMNWRSSATVPDELAAFHKLTDAALARAADAWNQQHHALRKLPLEIFELCWSFLDTSDLLRVAATCRLWRRLVHNSPALWTDLTFMGVHLDCSELSPLLERSRDASFDLSVTLYGSYGATELATVLRPHAHRLRRLELRQHQRYMYNDPVYMEFSAPALRDFVSHLPRLSFREGNFIFSCPNLKLMKVGALALDLFERVPPMRFGRVTSLTCRWNSNPLHGLYDAFPSLVNLDLTGIVSIRVWGTTPALDLPRDKKPPTTLRRVALRGTNLSYDDLAALGFTDVRELEIEGATDTLALFDALGGTPRSAVLQGKRLVIRANGPRNLRMSFDLEISERYYTVLSRPAVRENIRTLAISVEEPPAPEVAAFKPHFLFPADEFPALETLVLPAGHPLLDIDFMPEIGKLRAPALRRLAIIDTPRSCCDGVARRLNPLLLAVFIARHLELAPGRKLDELILDGEHGVALCEPEHWYDDGLDILLTHVTTISRRYWPQSDH